MTSLNLVLMLATLLLMPGLSSAEQKGYTVGGNYKDEVAANPCGCPSCMKNNADYARNCHASQAAPKKFDERATGPSAKGAVRATDIDQ